MRRDMTIRHMKIFISVFREQNITRAAETLYMTQPAVTRAIQEIEHYYGIKLFDRINQRLYVTETGKEFYEQALHIVDSFDAMEKGMKNSDEFGVIRIGASIALGNTLLPSVAGEFKSRHPGFKLRAVIKNGASLESDLLDNMLDFALIEGNVSSDSLVTEKFCEDRLLLILPPDCEVLRSEGLKLEDLQEKPLLLREKGSAGRAFLDSIFISRGIHIEPEWESVSTQAIVRAVSAGIGISILPEHLVKKEIDNGSIKTATVMDESFTRNNYIVWHKNKFLTKSARELMDICRELASKIKP
jgi:DNA-binding transcriptional LysR family regulator